MPKKQIPDEVWGAHKDAIISLFIDHDLTLEQLAGEMGKRGVWLDPQSNLGSRLVSFAGSTF